MMIPALGFGTYRLTGNVAQQSVAAALRAGYRHIDTAQIYGNEREVGRAIAASGVPRDELFVTTKVWVDHYEPDALLLSLEESLDRLQLDSVDLVLIHWPAPDNPVPMDAYLPALLEARGQCMTQHVGVSNFSIADLKQALELVGEGSLLTNQVEVHPYLQNRALVDFCRAEGIRVTAYLPLAYGKVNQDPVLQAIAIRHGVSAAQVSLAWLLQRGLLVIPSSTQATHIRDNLAAARIVLTDDDMAAIAALDRNERLIDPAELAPRQWD